MKKLFAVVMAVLTSLGLAWAQAWNHDPASPIGPLHWGTVTPSYATRAHNTLSAENAEVQVFYPFHPFYGAAVQILRKPKRGDGAVTVIDQAGKLLKIPVWMLSPDSSGIKISE